MLEFGELGDFVETIESERLQFFVPVSLQRISVEIGTGHEHQHDCFCVNLVGLGLTQGQIFTESLQLAILA